MIMEQKETDNSEKFPGKYNCGVDSSSNGKYHSKI
jgi:hypothetical protein